MLNTTSTIPKIRFPEFKDSWQVLKLSDVLKVKGKDNFDKKYTRNDVLSVSGDFGIVNQVKHLGRSYAGEKLDNYHVVDKGDVVYTKSPLKNTPYGIIKTNKNDAGIVSTLYAVYEVKNGYSHDFIDRYFELNDHTNRYLRSLVHKGAKNDMKINNDRVLIDPIIFPKLDEQKKIVKFLSVVDAYLENIKLQLKEIQKYKKGVFQKIFDQEIKFLDNDGNPFPDWELKKLGEVFCRITTKNAENNTNVMTMSAINGLISQKEYFNKNVSSANLKSYYLLHKGDFAYNKSYSNGYPMGTIKRLKLYDKGVVSPLYICFRLIDDRYSEEFFDMYFDGGHINHDLSKITQEGARNHGLLNISVNDFLEHINLKVPSLNEQNKIADFLSSINKLVKNKKDQLDQTILWKKALLQQLFV